MKITDIRDEIVRIPMRIPLKVAYGVIDSMTSVLVKIVTDEGVYGIGEAAPLAQVMGDSVDTIRLALRSFRPALIGMDAMNIEGIHRAMDGLLAHNTSAKCAVDLALYDIRGKIMGQPLYKVLGGADAHVESDVTIGIQMPEDMAREAKAYVDQGFRILKIKAGIDPEEDLRALRLIREAVGNRIRIRVDANQGYDEATAILTLPRFKELGIDAVEQFLPGWDMEGTARIRRQAGGVKIMVDESLHGPRDAMRMCRLDAADTFNIKLMKCGGIYPAMQINAIAEACGVTCMVGCMLETKIGLTAALSVVAARGNITEADCDSHLFAKDPEMGMPGGFTFRGSDFILCDKPGIGVDYDF